MPNPESSTEDLSRIGVSDLLYALDAKLSIQAGKKNVDHDMFPDTSDEELLDELASRVGVGWDDAAMSGWIMDKLQMLETKFGQTLSIGCAQKITQLVHRLAAGGSMGLDAGGSMGEG